MVVVRVMLSLMLVGAGLLSGIGAGGPGVAEASIVIGTNSCVGIDACDAAVGPIGDNSCNGNYACQGSTGSVGDDSCNGYLACGGTGSVADDSCNGYYACPVAEGPIGQSSCNGQQACQYSNGSIAAGSCNANRACWNAGPIGANSCDAEVACENMAYSVGNNSCNGDSNCRAFNGSVGDCQRNDVTPAACPAPQTTIDSGPSGTVASPHATFTFSSSLPTATFECSLDGDGFSACTTPKTYTDLAIGAHTFAVRARDGNAIDATPASTSWTIAIPYGEFNPSHTCATGTASVSFLGIQLTPEPADRWVLQRVWVYSTANGGSWTISDYYMAQFNAQGTEPQTFYRWTGSAWLDGSSQYDVSVPQGTSAAFYVQSWWLEGETWEGPYGTWAPNPSASTYLCGSSGPEWKRSSVTDLKPPSRSKLNRSPGVPSFTGVPSRRNQPRSVATQTGSSVGAAGISRSDRPDRKEDARAGFPSR